MTSSQIEKVLLDMTQEYNAIKSRCLHDFDSISEAFIRMFGEMPKRYFVSNAIDYEQTIENFKEAFDCYFPEYSVTYHTNSEGELEEEESWGEYLVFSETKAGRPAPSTIIMINDNFVNICTTAAYDELKEYIELDEESSKCEVFWVTRGQDGFIRKRLNIEGTDFDVKSHYNDDFDYEKVTKFIEDDKAGMVIFYGEPGTGKTYLIRNLALSHPDKTFYFMDKTTFAYIMDPTFIDFLQNAENSVFVLEDCEGLLMDRVQSGNELMSTILNLSDGILGDGMKIKFICTFNANLNNIDKALLRKGRLKYKYEFKKLTAKKTEELATLLDKEIPAGKELTVCDIYNWEEDNNVKEQRSHIGFGH